MIITDIFWRKLDDIYLDDLWLQKNAAKFNFNNLPSYFT